MIARSLGAVCGIAFFLPVWAAAPIHAETTLPADIIVAADGSGDYTTVQAAMESIPRDNRERRIVLIKDGVYREKVRVDAACVTLRGQSRQGTRIEFAQLNDDFTAKPDGLGRAVVNVNGDDFVMENLTVENTAGVVGKHAFAVYGSPDRTVIIECDVLSDGADTLALWNGERGRSYYARCNLRGAVDFICPRGWCYMADCTLFETKTSAAMWHDGNKNQDQKFVIRNCKFDGVPDWYLARHHADAAFYFLDCSFSSTMIDREPKRVIYPLGSAPATQTDLDRNRDLDRKNVWGERAYYHDCHRDGGDFAWFADNLESAPGSPSPESVTATWTFANTWDPESTQAPMPKKVTSGLGHLKLQFDEPVTVRGNPGVRLASGEGGDYGGRSGPDELVFVGSKFTLDIEITTLEIEGGQVFATQASARPRIVSGKLTVPDESK